MASAAELLAQSRYGRRRRRQRTPEGSVLHTILTGLATLGIPAYRIGVGGFRLPKADGGERFVRIGTKGLPDVLALPPGRGAVLIECKAPDGCLSPPQRVFRDACRKAGAIHVVARSLDDVLPFVTGRVVRGR